MKTATAFFTEDADKFARNYQCKPSFADRVGLFVDAVQRRRQAPSRILDFGCGPGVIASAVARLGHEVLGADGSEAMVARSNASAAAAGLRNLRFELVDAEDARHPAQSFDLVICSSVLEYLKDDLGLLANLVHSLKPGGWLLVSVPNAWSLVGVAECSLRHLRRCARLSIGRHFDYSLRHYSASRFTSDLASLGMVVERRTSFEFPLLGRAGVVLSRNRALGAMVLFEARRKGLQ